MDSVCNGNMSWNPFLSCSTELNTMAYKMLHSVLHKLGPQHLHDFKRHVEYHQRVPATRLRAASAQTRCSTTVTKTLWWSRFTPWRRWTRGGWLDTWRSWPGKVITVLAPLLMFITQDTYRWIIHTGTCHDLNIIACRNTGVVADSKASLCWL